MAYDDRILNVAGISYLKNYIHLFSSLKFDNMVIKKGPFNYYHLNLKSKRY